VAVGAQSVGASAGSGLHLALDGPWVRVYTGSCSSGRTLRVLEGFTAGEPLSAVAQSEDGCVLLTSSVESCSIRVWEWDTRARDTGDSPTLRGLLLGHRTGVVRLAVAASFAVAVSAGRDGRLLLWDLNRLSLVCTLRGGPALPITALRVHATTGEILAGGARDIVAWTVNGRRLGGRRVESPVLALAGAAGSEWGSGGVLVSGHADGSVCVWRPVTEASEEDIDSEGEGEGEGEDEGEEGVLETKTSGEAVESADGGSGEVFKKTRARRSSVSAWLDGTVGSDARPPFEWRLCRCARLQHHVAAVTAVCLDEQATRLWSGDAAGQVLEWSVPE
jgi:WD40 repeat protein